MSSLPKLQNVVILRSFAITAVVLYHCYCPWMYAWNWYVTPVRPFYSFIMDVMLVGRMPLFVFVSGYLFSHLYNDRKKYQDFIPFLSNKFKRLLVPCLLFTGLMAFCLKQNYFDMIIGSSYHLWFLKMLFWCFMGTWCIAHYIRKIWIEDLILVVSIFMMFIHVPNILGFSQFFKYFFFFIGGYMFYKYRRNLIFIYNKRVGWCIILIYMILCLLCAIRYLKNPILASYDIIHSDHIVVLSRYVLRPIMILMAFILVDWFISKSAISSKNIFNTLNKLSYGIYLFHMLMIQIIFKYLFEYTDRIFTVHYILAPLLMFVSIFLTSVFLTYLLQKTSWGKWLIG